MQVIRGTTKLLGVIGYPVEHSLSPIMHNAAIAQLQQDYVYLPFPIQPADLATALAGFWAMGMQGFNVTIPHKQAILPLLSEVTTIAAAVGAVNTVWRTATGWAGTNTDVVGWLAPLQVLEQDWTKVTVVILGNGGAARAVVAGCAQLGCAAIQVVGREQTKLQAFQQSWTNLPLAAPLSIHTWDQLPHLLSSAGLVVNTTPIGMSPYPEQLPFEATLFDQMPARAIAYDLIYTPNPTCWLEQAKLRGLVAINGLEMLVQQGAAALEQWIQQPAPVAVMRQTLRQHLGLD